MSKTVDINELVKRLRDTYWSGAPYMRELLDKSASALEAMAGEVKFLRDAGALVEANFRAADSRAEAAESERDRLKAALQVIASDPTHSGQAMIARKALGGDE